MKHSDELIVCRCENVSINEIEVAIAEGARSFDDVKRRVRAGMGMCQGRTCESLIVHILAQSRGGLPDRPMVRSLRMPLRPLPYSAIVRSPSDDLKRFNGKTLLENIPGYKGEEAE